MFPVIDLLFKKYVEEGLEKLKENPDKIRKYFSYASDKTKEDMVELITGYNIGVVSGYPREPAEMPCFVVAIAGEDEVPYGIGSGIDENYPEFDDGRDNYLEWTLKEDSKYIRENAQMRAQIRVEVWSDNAVITSFLYAIGKYALFSSKWEMDKEGLINVEISGGDLEPVPEYMTTFVYRRAIMVNFEYPLAYHVADQVIGEEEGHLPVGTLPSSVGLQDKLYSIDGDDRFGKEDD